MRCGPRRPSSRRSASPPDEAVEAIRASGRGTVVLVGFETDVCVAQEHERGLARMTGAGVERNHCKGLTFEWLHTVDRALEDFPQAAALGTPPWRL
jgi:hypothetical protein